LSSHSKDMELNKGWSRPILLVDDDRDMVDLIVLKLKKLGLSVVVAWDLESALQKEQELDQAPLLLLDHMLPGGTGLDVLTAMLERRPDTAAIVISSTEDAKAVVDYMKAGARDYLFKGDGFLDMLIHVAQKTMDVLAQEERLKLAENSSRLNEELLARSQNMALMGSWRRDLDTDELVWSDAMYQILEMNREQYPEPDDEAFLKRVKEADRDRLLDMRALTLNGKESAVVEFHYSSPVDEKEKVFRSMHDVDRDAEGRPRYIHGTLQDISEGKKYELERLKLSQAVEQSSASILITDPEGTIEYVNAKFLKVTQYEREEVIGQNSRFLNSGEHPEAFYKKLWRTLLSGQEWQGEFCNRKKNGDLFWESASISRILSEQGELLHYLAVKEDITEKKKFQKTMMKLNKALMAANRQTEKLAADFELFVPRQFTRRMKEEGPGSIRSGFAQEENITMFFADIRSFTALSESLGSEATFEFLNDYLHRVEPCIKNNDGFVDKFVGDGIVALFDGENGAMNAVKAAVEVQQTVEVFNRSRPEVQDIILGIGIHTGKVIIGALGSDSRLDSTVIGDSVNLAARVEELTKRFRADILITDSALSNMSEQNHLMRKVMSLKVRGKKDVTHIYEIFDANTEEMKQLKIDTKDELERGIQLYGEHQFDEALYHFEKVVRANESDILATDYMVRCRYLRKFPSSELSQLGVLEDLNHYLNHSAQRRDVRHETHLRGNVQWGDQGFDMEEVELTNLSLRGVKMEGCFLPLKIGSIIKLQMKTKTLLPYQKEDIEAVCQVVYVSEEQTSSYGLQFVWMSQDHENGVIYLLEQIEQQVEQ
jgi:PAS domain S-box-containing protein